MNRYRCGTVAALVIALFVLAGCSLFTTTLDEADAGSIQAVDVGDIVLIQLMGNATTGYEWSRIHPTSLDATPLDVVSENDYQAIGCEPIGGPGKYVFRYRAMRLGTVVLEFEHRRPWETDNPIDSYAITVWVR